MLHIAPGHEPRIHGIGSRYMIQLNDIAIA